MAWRNPAFLVVISASVCATAGAVKYRLGTSDYSPYTFFNASSGQWEGFGVEFARGMTAMCPEVEIEIVGVPWNDCWLTSDDGIGRGLDNGSLHACITYTHTRGERNDHADFGYSILENNKRAGLLARLEGGGPEGVDGLSNLGGLTVVDVAGFAPTPDTFGMTRNQCTDTEYGNFTITALEGYDEVLQLLLNGAADAVYLYSDKVQNMLKQCSDGMAGAGTNCSLWERFGKDFAYVQTGKFRWYINGTTLVLAKKGSGVRDALNPCTQTFMESEEYYHLCSRYPTLTHACFPNRFFAPADATPPVYNLETKEQQGPCSTGYCACTERAPFQIEVKAPEGTTTSFLSSQAVLCGVWGVLLAWLAAAP